LDEANIPKEEVEVYREHHPNRASRPLMVTTQSKERRDQLLQLLKNRRIYALPDIHFYEEVLPRKIRNVMRKQMIFSINEPQTLWTFS
jgi:hypothetical protein